MSDADYCRKSGWNVGTKLIGSDGHDMSIIELTAIGREGILAVCLIRNGKKINEGEHSWTLSCRNWRAVQP